MGSCRIPRPADPAAAARAEVVELLFACVERLRSHFDGIARSHDLTPVQAKVVLSMADPGSMGCVAGVLGCDPSNITGVVDRLEERGLLARAEDPSDRRVKMLRETAAGKRLREQFVAALFENVPGMERLTQEQVAGLRQALAAMAAEPGAQAPTSDRP